MCISLGRLVEDGSLMPIDDQEQELCSNGFSITKLQSEEGR